MLSPRKFFRVLESELPQVMPIANKLFRLQTPPGISFYWDNSSEELIRDPLVKHLAYSLETRKIHFFPKGYLEVLPGTLRHYREYISNFQPEDWAKILVCHEVPHAMCQNASGYEHTEQSIPLRQKLVVDGIDEGAALYGQRFILEKLGRRDFWRAYIATAKKGMDKMIKVQDETAFIFGGEVLIALYYLDKFIKEGEESYREFVRRKIELPTEEKIQEEFKHMELVENVFYDIVARV